MSIILTTVEELQEVAVDPAAVANSGFLYTKDALTITELFYRASDGTITQLTPPGGAGTTPWQRTGTTVALDQVGDTEVIPFTDDATSLGTSAIRWQDVNIAGAFGIWGPLGPVNPRVLLSTNGGGGRGALDFGNGGGTPVDARMRYAGTGLFDFSNPNAVSTSAGLIPRFDGEGGGVIGNATHRWAQFVCSGTYLINSTSGAANPRAQLQLDALKFGDGVLVVDVGIGRAGTTANTLEVSDGGILSGNLQPLVTATGKLGTTGVASSKAWQSVAVTSNYAVYTAAADANPTARLNATAVEFGPGAAVAVDVGLARSATGANTIELTNGGAGSGNFQPLVAATGKLGTTGTAISKAFQSAAVTTDFLVVTASTDANPTARVAGASLQMGAGGAVAVDVEIKRVAANILALSNAGAGTGSLVPNTDTQGSLGTNGAGGKTWASMSATSLAAYAAGTDTQPKIEIRTAAAGGEVRMGAGVAAAPDVYLSRTGAGTLTADDGGGNGITIVPLGDGTGNVGTAAKRFSLVRAVTITSGDVCFDDQTCQVCGQPFAEGDDLVLRVIRIEPDGDTGRRLTRTVPAHHGCK